MSSQKLAQHLIRIAEERTGNGASDMFRHPILIGLAIAAAAVICLSSFSSSADHTRANPQDSVEALRRTI